MDSENGQNEDEQMNDQEAAMPLPGHFRGILAYF